MITTMTEMSDVFATLDRLTPRQRVALGQFLGAFPDARVMPLAPRTPVTTPLQREKEEVALAFFHDCCELRAATISAADLFAAFNAWRGDKRGVYMTQNGLAELLRSHFPDHVLKRRVTEGDSRRRALFGIGLRESRVEHVH